MKHHRLARLGEVIREVASTTILFELKDPRVKGVTVTRTEVAADLQHAKVFVSIMGTEKQQQLAMHGLRNSTGFIQSKIAKQVDIRYLPVLEFVLDLGVKKSMEISRILAEEKAKSAGSAVIDADAAEIDDEKDEDDVADEDDSATTEPPPGQQPVPRPES